jgi:pimeloyl-ACP methyl ester carboxylesterase
MKRENVAKLPQNPAATAVPARRRAGADHAFAYPRLMLNTPLSKIDRSAVIEKTGTAMLAMLIVLTFPVFPRLAAAQGNATLEFGAADIGHGIVLHYAEQGGGVPVVFVHGSLSEMTYWQEEVAAFAKQYRAITYSRRYNVPNHNPARPGYSAVTDAEDLAGFIRTLHLDRVYVIGHSYGALTALYLAREHPELIRAMVLAEPPAIPLLEDISGPDRARALELYADIQRRMVAPMRRDFRAGRREAGVADFIDYVFADPDAWTRKFSAEDRAETMRNAHEWDVMMTSGTLFPPLPAGFVASIHVPTLIMSGGKSYPFLALIDAYLAAHIPDAEAVTYPDAGHQMWLQDAVKAREAAERFFAKHPE